MEQLTKQSQEIRTSINVPLTPIHMHDPWDLLGQGVKYRFPDETTPTEPPRRKIKYSRDDSL